MKQIWTRKIAIALIVLASTVARGADRTEIQFHELLELLRTNLAGADAASLNGAAVRGLLRQLAPRVLLDGVTAVDTATNAPLVSDEAIFDRHFGYVRIGRFAEGLAAKFNETIDGLSSSNRLKGLVIDLRYAGGGDYASAVSTADLFFATEQPLLDWGTGVKKSTQKEGAISVPVAILVNRETRGAAEAFAGILRQGRVALLLGTNTAGEACLYRDFSLSNGSRVRVATSTVRLGNNEALPATGLKPDLVIEVAPDAERLHFADAFAVKPPTGADLAATNQTAAGGTNRPPRRRINEAELVRAQREGREPGDETNRVAHSEPPRPTVTDPALARALDLLKGLALIQQFRGR